MSALLAIREAFADLRAMPVESRSAENPSYPLTAAELIPLLGGTPTAAGVYVNSDSAMRSSAVWACVNLLARSVATLPCIVYRRLADGGKERAPDHPLYDLLHDEPNEDSSSADWYMRGQTALCLRGNCYSAIQTAGSGRVVSLTDIHPSRVRVRRTSAGRKVYDVTLNDGKVDTVAQSEILHPKGLSLDGLIGLNPIEQMRLAVGLAISAEEFGAALFANSSRPSGLLKAKNGLSDEARTRLAAQWATLNGGGNRSGTAVLEEGMEWEQITINPQDAQFLETRKFQKADIANIFFVEPSMIGASTGDSQTYANIEQRMIAHVTNALRPWLVIWERELNRKLFSASDRKKYFIEFNVDALLRGDSTSRANFFEKACGGPWMKVNEVRAIDNMNPVDGGEVLRPPRGISPAAQQEPGGLNAA